MKIVFNPDGTVRAAWLEYSPFPGTPTADCLLEIVRTLHSEPFSGPPFVMGADFLVGTDPGGNATFGNFDHAGAAAAIDAAAADAHSCLGSSPPIHVSVAVSAPGTADEVTVDATGPVADCIREKMRALRVPPYCGLRVFLEAVVR